jgi:hypothetical protein
MTRFKVAHVREQGNDLIIVPLDRNFGQKSPSEQQDVSTQLQWRARSAGLAGTVVPVWDNGGGRMGFLAPRGWHPFFASVNLGFVLANLNKEIYW